MSRITLQHADIHMFIIIGQVPRTMNNERFPPCGCVLRRRPYFLFDLAKRSIYLGGYYKIYKIRALRAPKCHTPEQTTLLSSCLSLCALLNDRERNTRYERISVPAILTRRTLYIKDPLSLDNSFPLIALGNFYLRLSRSEVSTSLTSLSRSCYSCLKFNRATKRLPRIQQIIRPLRDNSPIVPYDLLVTVSKQLLYVLPVVLLESNIRSRLPHKKIPATAYIYVYARELFEGNAVYITVFYQKLSCFKCQFEQGKKRNKRPIFAYFSNKIRKYHFIYARPTFRESTILVC